MAGLIEFSDEADRDFSKLDKPIQRRVFRYLHERIANAQDARDFGKPLHTTSPACGAVASAITESSAKSKTSG